MIYWYCMILPLQVSQLERSRPTRCWCLMGNKIAGTISFQKKTWPIGLTVQAPAPQSSGTTPMEARDFVARRWDDGAMFWITLCCGGISLILNWGADPVESPRPNLQVRQMNLCGPMACVGASCGQGDCHFFWWGELPGGCKMTPPYIPSFVAIVSRHLDIQATFP